MARYDYLIVDAGLFGSVFAHAAREGGRSCLVIDRREAVDATYHAEAHTYNAPQRYHLNYTSKHLSNQSLTQIIEHTFFEFGNQQHTIITREFSETFELGREPYYTVNDSANSAICAEYQRVTAAEANVRFGGRLGSYSYFDMDDAIAAALAPRERERLC